MIVIRPIRKNDLDTLVRLAQEALIGITNLPGDKRLLEHRITKSLDSFQQPVVTPGNELYCFVAEESGVVIGTSSIFATTGGNEPLYFYRKESHSVATTLDYVVKSLPVLSPVSYVRGPSEVCALFLSHAQRSKGVGKLLSFARFLFMAEHLHRFTGTIAAELRGVIGNDSVSPFWEYVGKTFCQLSLTQAFNLLQYGRSFIGQFLPKYPIYLSLLPEAVRAVIGQPHPLTKPALALLLEQGFEITDEIDVFDGGPKLRAYKDRILAIRNSQLYEVAKIEQSSVPGKEAIIANCRLDFRALLGTVHQLDEGRIALSPELAKGLEIGVREKVRIYTGSA